VASQRDFYFDLLREVFRQVPTRQLSPSPHRAQGFYTQEERGQESGEGDVRSRRGTMWSGGAELSGRWGQRVHDRRQGRSDERPPTCWLLSAGRWSSSGGWDATCVVQSDGDWSNHIR